MLQRVWGYDDFRYQQRRAVLAALHGRDCLAILPTGGGKSLCYQVPALLLPGLTLVVSPLIALMQDQVAALRRRGVAAAYLSSTQSAETQAQVRAVLAAGRLKLLYVAPERLAQLASGAPLGISLLAVDEAHCISEWGHDFRPHYRTIGRLLGALGRPPIIALTATATPETRTDIARVLHLRWPVTITTSFDRPNLRFAVRPFATERPRLEALVTLLRATRESVVVYLPTRNRTDGVATILRRWGFSAAPYHAGLPGNERRALLRRFMDGRIRIIVATNAFGMGIDKPDVRLVAHLGVPARPESYYQEAGRAGRDGAPARCELLWVPGDVTLARTLSRGGKGAAPAATRGFSTMTRYLTTSSCRRRVLLEYLGESIKQCGGCDNCRPQP
ncbi:MAG: ATP-dependent DNA helicase RecQ [Gemmatimonadetes bacterium]|nr:ATP-dependent DNA helicase RecQ [Gemmatimonadota bacterium]